MPEAVASQRELIIKLASAYAALNWANGFDALQSGVLREATAHLGMPNDWLSNASTLALLRGKGDQP